MIIDLPDKPELDDLDNALLLIAKGVYVDIENSQINAIKTMISLRLALKRLNNQREKAAILDGFETV